MKLLAAALLTLLSLLVAPQALSRELVRVTSSPYYEADPAWSPVEEEIDGLPAARLAFARFDGRNQEIWTVLVGRGDAGAAVVLGEERQLTSGGGVKAHPSWSYDGTQLYYEEMQSGGGYLVKALSLATPDAAPRMLADGRQPTAGPGGKLVYVSEGAVFAVDEGSTVPRIIGVGGRCSSPAWTPDGRRVFFSCGLFIGVVYDRVGNGAVSYYIGPPAWPVCWNGYPAISPKGEILAFASTRDRTYGIWGVPLDRSTADASLIFQDKYRKAGLCFSPETAAPRLAFASDRAGGWDIWVLDVNADLFREAEAAEEAAE